MPEQPRASRPVRKRVKQNPHRKSALLRSALRMEMRQRSSLFLLRLALRHQLHHLKGIWLHASLSPLKASNPASPAVRRTERRAQAAASAATHQAVVEPPPAPAKVAWTSASVEETQPPTVLSPDSAAPPRSALLLRAS